MSRTRLLAVLGAASALVAPAAHAQQAPAHGEPLAIEATVSGYATGGDGGAVGTTTASGAHTRWGTVAADWRLYPLGTKLRIEGFPDEVFIVEDTGGGISGNTFDVWFPELATAEAFGTRRLTVTLVPPGAGEKP